jgi:hypothetical protein
MVHTVENEAESNVIDIETVGRILMGTGERGEVYLLLLRLYI